MKFIETVTILLVASGASAHVLLRSTPNTEIAHAKSHYDRCSPEFDLVKTKYDRSSPNLDNLAQSGYEHDTTS